MHDGILTDDSLWQYLPVKKKAGIRTICEGVGCSFLGIPVMEYPNGTDFIHESWMGYLKLGSPTEMCFIVYQDGGIHDIVCDGHARVVGLCQIRCPGMM